MEQTSTARRRPQSSRGDIRETELLDIAEMLLHDGRFDETSIAEIAAMADISRSAFYFYFASKQALLERLIKSTLDELVSRHAARVERSHQSPAERLRGSLHDVADMWIEHGVVLSAAAELAAGVPAIFDRIAGVIAAGVDVVAPMVVETGTPPEAAAVCEARETATALLWMGERSFYVLARRHPAPAEFHRLADRLFIVWARAAGMSPTCLS